MPLTTTKDHKTALKLNFKPANQCKQKKKAPSLPPSNWEYTRIAGKVYFLPYSLQCRNWRTTMSVGMWP